jgi:hypothetical protein
VVQIPTTPAKFKKEAILERRKMFERAEGEVRIQYSIIKILKTTKTYYFKLKKALKQIDLFEKRFKSQNKGTMNK